MNALHKLPRNGGLVRASQNNIRYARTDDVLDIQPLQATAFRANFLALDQLMDKFHKYSTPLDQFQGLNPHATRDLLVTHSLAYTATIQLHKNFSSRNANSNRKCLDAASAVVTILNSTSLSEVVYMDPIMGVRTIRPV